MSLELPNYVWRTQKDRSSARDECAASRDEGSAQGRHRYGRIVPQYALLSPNAQQLLQVGSKIDFVLTIGDDEDVYLACECKRLNVPYKKKTRALAHEYVRDGLMRFVAGQYSHGLPLAMMLGYVMNKDADIAHKRVKRAIGRSKTAALKSAADETIVAGKPIRFSTTHACTTGQDIQIRHTLLAWP